MKTRTRLVALVLVAAVAIGVVLVCVPVISVPNQCGTPFICIPGQKDSVSAYYLGFGVETTFNGTYYYFCTSQGCSSL